MAHKAAAKCSGTDFRGGRQTTEHGPGFRGGRRTTEPAPAGACLCSAGRSCTLARTGGLQGGADTKHVAFKASRAPARVTPVDMNQSLPSCPYSWPWGPPCANQDTMNQRKPRQRQQSTSPNRGSCLWGPLRANRQNESTPTKTQEKMNRSHQGSYPWGPPPARCAPWG